MAAFLLHLNWNLEQCRLAKVSKSSLRESQININFQGTFRRLRHPTGSWYDFRSRSAQGTSLVWNLIQLLRFIIDESGTIFALYGVRKELWRLGVIPGQSWWWW
ncbi:uncharacterized protein LOC135225499 [Macrobrachium nipponense]|uniref:uncharacterized protein LOC135225499 n=1 Tax=Macrobrachium nipponense TaxID=159736 RepID=UPI0030C7B1D2